MTKRKRPAKVRLYSSRELDVSGLPLIQRENARLFVHFLITRRIFNRRLKGQTFIPMNSEIIRRYIPNRQVASILDYLKDTGQVERTGYSEGCSRRYRLSDHLQRSRCLVYPPKSSAIARKLVRLREERDKDTGANKRPVHKHLDFWLKSVRVDEKAALQFVSDNHSKSAAWLSSLLEVPSYAEELNNERLHAEASILAITNKDLFSTVCKYGRYHSNITSFRKVLRPFLQFDEKPLSEIDVSACQPLCLAVHLHEIKYNILTSVSFSDEQLQLFHKLFTLPVCCASQNKDDASRYQKDCETGKFYDRMKEFCEVASLPKVKKKLFAEVFFGKRKGGRLLNGFRKLYPTMGRLIDWVKRHDYKHLSHTLQRIESSIVIDDACDVMRVQHPDVPILTIHDAILTTPENADLVTGIMMAAFRRRGVSPQIKRKQLQRPTT